MSVAGGASTSRRAVLGALAAGIMVLVIGYVQSAKRIGLNTEHGHRRKRMKPPRVFADVLDAEAYTATFGWPAGLPTLHVSYGDNKVEGAATQFNASTDRFLTEPPTVTWGKRLCKGPCTVLMLDPDAPERSDDPDGATPGRYGPWLHGIWTDCHRGPQSASKCKTEVSYWPPHPPAGNHRYILLLYKQTGGEVTVSKDQRLRKKWDVQGFLKANPGLEPAAINFFYSY